MRRHFLAIVVATVSMHLLSAASALGRTADDDVKGCLKAWGDNPFNAAKPVFTTLGTSVKVLGVGDTVEDLAETKAPALVYIKFNVAVLSSATLKLMNPNGWYCLQGKVDVLSKSKIQLQCDAKLATSSDDSVTVLGAQHGEKHVSVTVLGSTSVERVGCK
jgi:hypothetical protein